MWIGNITKTHKEEVIQRPLNPTSEAINKMLLQLDTQFLYIVSQ